MFSAYIGCVRLYCTAGIWATFLPAKFDPTPCLKQDILKPRHHWGTRFANLSRSGWESGCQADSQLCAMCYRYNDWTMVNPVGDRAYISYEWGAICLGFFPFQSFFFFPPLYCPAFLLPCFSLLLCFSVFYLFAFASLLFSFESLLLCFPLKTKGTPGTKATTRASTATKATTAELGRKWPLRFFGGGAVRCALSHDPPQLFLVYVFVLLFYFGP